MFGLGAWNEMKKKIEGNVRSLMKIFEKKMSECKFCMIGFGKNMSMMEKWALPL